MMERKRKTCALPLSQCLSYGGYYPVAVKSKITSYSHVAVRE
ncbi:hypothetical protein [Thermospira aquatica]|nr:hypothetical protein [Thermospira aquatica]